jgi:hypothetical protein
MSMTQHAWSLHRPTEYDLLRPSHNKLRFTYIQLVLVFAFNHAPYLGVIRFMLLCVAVNILRNA